MKKQIMRDNVKGLGEVKKDKQGDHSFVDSALDIVGQLDQRRLRTMASPKASLKWIDELRVIKERGELVHDTLKDFGEETENGDGLKIKRRLKIFLD